VKAVGSAFCEQGVWKDLPQAIKDGAQAVEWRKYVTAKHEWHECGDEGHAHMLECLERWLADLRGVSDLVLGVLGGGPTLAAGSEGTEGTEGPQGPFAFRNMYDVLMEEADTEQEVGADLGLFESASARTSASASASASAASARASANARFDEDKDFFFLCAFHDLDEMMRVVQLSWADYKAERSSHTAATIVTGAAIKMALRSDALMQITYPAVRTANNFLEILKKTLNSTGRMGRMVDQVVTVGSMSSTEKLGLDTTIPDFLFTELRMIANHMQSFSTCSPSAQSW
jgi:hypothetical protein